MQARLSSLAWFSGLFLLAPVALGAGVESNLLTLPAALPAPSQMLVMLVAAPVLEEWVFRAHLQPWLAGRLLAQTSSQTGAHLAAIVATSAAFAAMHWVFNPLPAAWWVFLPSLAFGVLQAKTSQWQLCAALHSSYNAVWCLAIWLQVR